MRALQIAGRTVGGEDSRVFVVAELSSNHGGSYDVAARTLEAMATAGADAVKLQTYTADAMTLDDDRPMFRARQGTLWEGRRLWDLYDEGTTPYDWHEGLKRVAEDHGLVWFSTPFDAGGVALLESLDVAAFKIASLEITDVALIRTVAEKGRPVILSTGMADPADIELAVRTCREAGNDQIGLLLCTSAYPTPLGAVHLRTIPHLARTYDVVPGLSDHTTGLVVPVGAVALGARIVEKHFILDRSLGGNDAAFSLEPDEFRAMVQAVRDTEEALGEVRHRLDDGVRDVRRSARSLFVVQDVGAGEAFTEVNVRSLRPGYGLHPKHLGQVLGGRAAVDVERGTPLAWEHLSVPPRDPADGRGP